jgi:hypothetical protein
MIVTVPGDCGWQAAAASGTSGLSSLQCPPEADKPGSSSKKCNADAQSKEKQVIQKACRAKRAILSNSTTSHFLFLFLSLLSCAFLRELDIRTSSSSYQLSVLLFMWNYICCLYSKVHADNLKALIARKLSVCVYRCTIDLGDRYIFNYVVRVTRTFKYGLPLCRSRGQR